MRRILSPVVFLTLAGCQAIGAPGAPLLAIPAAVEAVSLRAFGRTTGDSIVSLVTGEDCSIARIGRGEAYCGRDDAPPPQPMCTRSLGSVDCWTVPPAAWPAYRGVANGPSSLSEAQENNRIGWARRIGRALEPAPSPPPEPPQGAVAVVVPGPGYPAPPQAGAAAAEAAARSLIPAPGPSMGAGLRQD